MNFQLNVLQHKSFEGETKHINHNIRLLTKCKWKIILLFILSFLNESNEALLTSESSEENIDFHVKSTDKINVFAEQEKLSFFFS